MAISNAYPTGIPVADADLFVGTKAYTNRTVNYTAQGIADYLNINAKVSIGGQMSFRFSITPDISKTISFEGGLGNNTPFADITRLVTSGSDASGSDITIFLNYLIDTQILLAEQNQPNNFGHYKITGYSQIGITDFYNLDLEYIGGNGNIVDDTYYDLVSFNLSGGVGATPTLQQVTTEGNETTNNIIHRSGTRTVSLSGDGDQPYVAFYDDNLPGNLIGVYVPQGFIVNSFDEPTTTSNITLFAERMSAFGFQTSAEDINTPGKYINTYLNFPVTSNEAAGAISRTFNFPDKPDGAYIFATTDDIIAGGVETVSGALVDNADPLNPIVNTPGLTEVVLQGPEVINGESFLTIGTNDIVPFILWQNKDTPSGNNTRLLSDTTIIDIYGGTASSNTNVKIFNGEFSIKQSDPIISKSTTINFEPPTNDVIIKFPAKAVDGTYTLATLDDITGSGTVTSVDLTMPSAFSVSGNPVTTAGTIAVTGAGLTSQYIRGDGTLANFPSFTGGGASTSYYLNGSVSQGTIGGVAYKEMNGTPVIGTGTDFTINADGYIAQFITDAGDPNKLLIPAGNWNFETYFSASSGGGSPKFYIELYKYDGATFTLISSNSATPENITGGTSIDLYFTALAVPPTTLLATDRLAVRFYVIHSGRTITMHTENSHLSQIITTFSTGLTSLNGLTAQAQTFVDDTNVTVVSSGTAHTVTWAGTLADSRIASSTAWNNKLNDILLSDICINMPQNGLTTINNVVGAPITIGGTPGIRTITDTNLFTRTTRVGIETTIVPANVFTFRQVVGYFSINSGFKASFKFGGSTGATNTNVRYSIGVFVANFIVTNVDPTTYINCMAFARIDGNNNWQFIHNDNTGTATAIDLGASFPANTVSTDMYYGVIETVGGNIKYTLTRLNTGDTVTGTVSSNLVASSTLLGMSAGCTNNANAAVCALDFGGMQLTKFT